MKNDYNKDESTQKSAILKAILEKKRQNKFMQNSIEIIPRKEKENCFISSFEQRRLWFLHKLNPDDIAYNVYFGFRIYGKLEVNLLQKALNQIGMEHESFRTKFKYINEEVMQIVEPSFNGQIKYINLFNVKSENIEKEALKLAQNEVDKPFDLENGPLVRFLLIEISAEERLFITIVHHIIFDGWSMGIFYRELTQKYNNLCHGIDCGQEQNKVQYGDYAEWQKKYLLQNKMEKQFKYWKERLKNIDQDSGLPTDRKRTLETTGNGDVIKFKLKKRVAEKLREYAIKNNFTISNVLLSAYKCLLYKYTMKSNITVGTAVASRNITEVENVIGFFVNTVVLNTQIHGNMKFSDLVKQVKKTVLEAYDNQDFPFDQLVQRLNPVRETGINPFFQVIFNYLNTSKSKLELYDLKVKEYELGSRKSIIDLELQVEDNGIEIFGYLGYNSDLFFSETIKRICNQFQLILEDVLNGNDKSIDEVSLLDENEIDLILNKFNDTYVDYSREKTVVDIFEEEVEKAPDNIAVVYGEEKLTYRELNEKANSLGLKLRQMGVKPDDFVVISAERSLEMIIGILGIIKAGGAYVPIDPEYPEERIKYMVGDCKPKVLVTYKTKIEVQDIPTIDLGDSKVFEDINKNLNKVNKPNDLLYVIYTSGTTGKPKGVMIENTGVLNLREYFIRNHNITKEDRILQFASLAFDAMVSELYTSLLNGASLYIITKEEQKDTSLFERFVDRNKITMVILPPPYLGQVRLKGIKHVISAGSESNMEIVKENSKYAEYSNDYGPTEVTVCATHWLCEEKDKIPERIPIGKPIENKQIYILNGMSLCGIGMPGELCISGDGLARGYLNKPELMVEKFIKNPYGEGRLYRTGDLARWLPDGNIEYLGRIDNQVKIRGYRIELSEVESVVKKYRKIKECVAVGKNNKFGEKDLLLYYVSEEELTASELIQYLSAILPNYMIPQKFIPVSEIPITVNGKVNTKALLELERNCLKLENDYREVTTEFEKEIRDIWISLLDANEIGMNDNFFEVGGDSIKLLIMHNEIQKVYPNKIDITDVFAYPTIYSIAKYIENSYIEDVVAATVITESVETVKFPKDYIVSKGEDNKGSRLKFKFENEVYYEMEKMCKDNQFEIENLLLAGYVFLLSEVSNEYVITTHVLIDKYDKVNKLKLDISNIDNFYDIVNLVKNNIQNMESYYIDSYSMKFKNSNDNLITPLFSKVNNFKYDYSNIYDLIFKMNQGINEIEIICEFNDKKLKQNRISELFLSYVNLIQMVINNSSKK